MKEYDLNQFGAVFTLSDLAVIDQVKQIAKICNAKIYLTGGFIRDRLIALSNNVVDHIFDYDFVVEGCPATELARKVALNYAGNFVLLDQAFDTARVIVNNAIQLDFAGISNAFTKAISIKDDVLRRDFTINALIYDPYQPHKIIDYVDGIIDLKDKRIRHISNDVFTADPLRLLRAFRFSGSLNFTIAPKTILQIKQDLNYITSVAIERINHELFLIMSLKNSFALIKPMADLGLIELIYEDLAATHKVSANSYHHLGLFEHSLETYHQVEINFNELNDLTKQALIKPLNYNLNYFTAVKLAGLLHDIGKPSTWVIQEDGRHSFYKHDSLGAKMIATLGLKHKWPNNLIKFMVNLVKWHLRPGSLYYNDRPTLKAINRFYSSVNEYTPSLILLALADLGATLGSGFKEANRQILKSELLNLLSGYSIYQEKQKLIPKLLDGNQIIDLLGIDSGPIIGQLLAELKDAQTNGEISQIKEAQAFIQNIYHKRYSR